MHFSTQQVIYLDNSIFQMKTTLLLVQRGMLHVHDTYNYMYLLNPAIVPYPPSPPSCCVPTCDSLDPGGPTSYIASNMCPETVTNDV